MLETFVEDFYLRAWGERTRRGLNLDPNSRAFSDALVEVGVAISEGGKGIDEVAAAKAAGWALAVSRPEITTVEPSVVELVDGLRVEGSPEEVPGLLRNGGCFVRVKGDRPLVQLEADGTNPAGHVRAIALHYATGAWYVSTFEHQENRDYIFGYRCQLEWGAPSIEAALVEDRYQGGFPGLEHLSEAQRQRLLPTDTDRLRVLPALRWVLGLAVLLDARGAPLDPIDGASAERILRPKRYRAARGVQYRTIRLSSKGIRPATAPELPTEASPRPHLERREVPVSGFLRRQPVGPGRKERRWQWIDGFRAVRWVKPETPDAPVLKSSVRRAPEED